MNGVAPNWYDGLGICLSAYERETWSFRWTHMTKADRRSSAYSVVHFLRTVTKFFLLLLLTESLPNRYSALYNWPTSAHASQAFSIAHCTDSEDLPCSQVSESANQLIVVISVQLLGVTLQFYAPEQRDTAKDVLLFPDQHYGIHSHCLFMIHHWHWLSSVRVWILCYSAEHTKH